MTDKETIENLQYRLNILSDMIVEMFKVVAHYQPATNDHFRQIVRQWEEADNKYPLPLDEFKDTQ